VRPPAGREGHDQRAPGTPDGHRGVAAAERCETRPACWPTIALREKRASAWVAWLRLRRAAGSPIGTGRREHRPRGRECAWIAPPARLPTARAGSARWLWCAS